MITSETAINIIQALSPEELDKVRDYIIATYKSEKPKKRKRKEVVLRPEHSRRNLKSWLLEQNGTKVINETKPAKGD